MGNQSSNDFIDKYLDKNFVSGKNVIEVGSYVVNHSIRPIFENLGAASYLGIDINSGPGVDKICNADDLVTEFGKEKFDILISLELLEHVRNWQRVISNFKNILKPGGMILIGTRSKGFDYHGYPYDFWRYEIDDIKNMFSDFEIIALEKDPICPGVFFLARKPDSFIEKDISKQSLYSIVARRRKSSVSFVDILLVRTLFPVMIICKNILRKLSPKPLRIFIRKNILDKLP